MARFQSMIVCLLVALVAITSPALVRASGPTTVPTTAAAPIEYRIPLQTQKVSAGVLWTTVGAAMNQQRPAAEPADATIDLTGDNATAFITHLVDTLGSVACTATVEGDTLSIKLAASRAHSDVVAMRRLARVLSTGRAFRPEQKDLSYGLIMGTKVVSDRPMTILIHGLDSDLDVWDCMTHSMKVDGGWQAAFFRYPDDGPITSSAELFADCLADARLRYPKITFNILAHSMGGLVAREYVEGPMYRAQSINRLVMVGTPNHGSPYTRLRWALEWAEHCKRCKIEKNWNWAKMKEDGDGEASDDLKPDSSFLKTLNARPRREGVAYTIIAGNQSAIRNVAADWMNCTADCLSGNVWGLRHARAGLVGKANDMRAVQTDNDGPVPVESAKLDGVTDFHVIHADHMALVVGYPPASWELLKARLK